jgi:hypothetical protein
MRKRNIGDDSHQPPPAGHDELNLEALALVEVTSEERTHPVEARWRAPTDRAGGKGG